MLVGLDEQVIASKKQDIYKSKDEIKNGLSMFNIVPQVILILVFKLKWRMLLL